MINKKIYIPIIVFVLLAAAALPVWLLPMSSVSNDTANSTVEYGVSEGMELVEQRNANGEKCYVVRNAAGAILFTVPLKNCLLDTKYRNGKLLFREMSTGRNGYIDRDGFVVFADDGNDIELQQEANGKYIEEKTDNAEAVGGLPEKPAAGHRMTAVALPSADITAMAKNNPFYKEAAKVTSGKLDVMDAKSRKMILNYCEHFRTAYTTKDLDFLKQVFSDEALIIVGNVVKPKSGTADVEADGKVAYSLHSKKEYILRIAKTFAMNKKIDVRFSDFKIMRHPTIEGIYGVSMRQQYRSDNYADDGFLFILWDFRNSSMPVIHVRTWQPKATVTDGSDVIGIGDFNLN